MLQINYAFNRYAESIQCLIFYLIYRIDLSMSTDIATGLASDSSMSMQLPYLSARNVMKLCSYYDMLHARDGGERVLD